MMSDYDEQDRETHDRREEQLLRERMLDGQHTDDIINEILRDYAPEIAAELTLNPDLSENTFRMVLSQLSVSYDEAPIVSAEGVEDFDAIITPSVWPKMQQRDILTRGLRECFVRLDWPSSDSAVQEVTYRVIAPGHILKCIALEGQPDRPGCLTERRSLRSARPRGPARPAWMSDRATDAPPPRRGRQAHPRRDLRDLGHHRGRARLHDRGGR